MNSFALTSSSLWPGRLQRHHQIWEGHCPPEWKNEDPVRDLLFDAKRSRGRDWPFDDDAYGLRVFFLLHEL